MGKIKTFAKKQGAMFFACLLPTFVLFVFAPFENYFTNIYEYTFTGWVLLWGVLKLFVPILIGLFLIGMFLPEKLKRIYSALLLASGIGFYLQGNFFEIASTEVEEGGANLLIYANATLSNNVFWVVLFLGVVGLLAFKKIPYKKVVAGISGFLVGIQLLTLIFFMISIVPNQNGKYTLSTDGTLTLSTKQNVVVFLLDKMDKDYFEQAIEESPQTAAALKDFTYFPNHTGSFPFTTGALPYILTGDAYDNSVPYQSYLKEAWSETEFYKDLQANNFDVRIMPSKVVKIHMTEEVAFDNVVRTASRIGMINTTEQPNYYAVYRYLPHALKSLGIKLTRNIDKLFSVDYGRLDMSELARAQADVVFHNFLKAEGVSAMVDKNAFRFYYLSGSHEPYSLLEDASYDTKTATVMSQTKGSLKIVADYMEMLKEKGLYDNTQIIILADHGDAQYSGEDVELLKQPSLLVKPFNTRQDSLQVNKKPASHKNFFATCLMGTQVPAEKYGYNAFNVPDDVEKTFNYVKYHQTQMSTWFNTIFEYQVFQQGDRISFAPTGTVYSPANQKEAVQAVSLDLSKRINAGIPTANLEETNFQAGTFYDGLQVQVNSGETIFLRGWAFDSMNESDPEAIYIKIGEKYYLTKSIKREDVGRYHNLPRVKNCGFETVISVDDLDQENPSKISIITISKDKKTYQETLYNWNIEIKKEIPPADISLEKFIDNGEPEFSLDESSVETENLNGDFSVTLSPGKDFHLKGWASDYAANKAPSAVYLKVGELFYSAEITERADVVDYLKNSEMLNSGFELRLPYDVFPMGTTALKLVIFSNDGTSYALSPYRWEITK